jgi:hypothetical protein
VTHYADAHPGCPCIEILVANAFVLPHSRFTRKPAGSGCDSGRLCGGSGKHRAVAGRLCWNWGCVRGWQVIPLAVGLVPGTSRRPRPCPWGFPMHTSNRSAFLHCSRTVSVTNSNRRVRTRTHGGVAGCVKKARKRCAVRKMKVDPSEPSCRGRLQTAMSRFGQKPRW